MRTILLFFVFIVMIGFPQEVNAALKCGNVDKRAVKNALRSAGSVKLHLDVVLNLEKVCHSLQTIKTWQRREAKDYIDKAFKTKHEMIVEAIEDDFRGIDIALTLYKGLLFHDPASIEDSQVRIIKLRRAKKDVYFHLRTMGIGLGALKDMVKSVHVPKEDKKKPQYKTRTGPIPSIIAPN